MSNMEQFKYFTPEKDKEYIRRTIQLARQAVANGNTPFGALLVDPKGEILLEQENIEVTDKDYTGHAEIALIRHASRLYSKDYLGSCSLYCSGEPCPMCSGAIFWGGIGRLVFGLSSKRLHQIMYSKRGNINVMDLSCRDVLESSKRKLIIRGPIEELTGEIEQLHINYW